MTLIKNIKRLKKRDWLNILLIILVMSAVLMSLTRMTYVFGSKTDWSNQHWAIPQYFRTLFYDTHDFFPSFAPNIGAGQNIYYLAYYGLYSPLIFLSYLFPMVSMMNYIIILSISLLFVDVILFYSWIRGKFGRGLTLSLTFLFAFSVPLIFHSHRHIMFVNYMPFLLLALMAVDSYFETHRKTGLVISCFLIIMTSYFFSVGSLLTIGLYAIFVKLSKEDKFELKSYVRDGLKILGCMFVSIMMAAVLILPTFYVLLNGRDTASSKTDFMSFIPNANLLTIVYNPFSLGLTAISFASIFISAFSKKKNTRFLAITILVFVYCPLIIYILNGAMYTDAKVLIPMIPLVLLITADVLRDVIEGKIKLKRNAVIVTCATVVSFFMTILTVKYDNLTYICIVFVIDVIVTMLCLILFVKYKRRRFIGIPIVVFSLAACLITNFADPLLKSNNRMTESMKEVKELVSETLDSDTSLYRFGNMVDTHGTVNLVYDKDYYQSTIYSSTHNKRFSSFYFNEIYNETRYRNAALTTQPRNFLFNIFMGEKYIIADVNETISGYEKIKQKDTVALFKTDYAFPVGHSSNKIMSYSEYSKLTYPYNIEALLEYEIVDEEAESGYESHIEKLEPSYNPPDALKGANPSKRSMDIILSDDLQGKIELGQKVDDKLLLLRFSTDNTKAIKSNDVWIEVNGTRNKLTSADWKYCNNNYVFEYVFIIDEPTDELDITLSKGEYIISDLEAYTMPLEDVYTIRSTLDEFSVDGAKTEGDRFVGDIQVSNDGYFVMSIPYDEGFEIYIDGEKTECLKVNSNFIGAKISKGNHHVEIKYTAPLLHKGIFISMLGVLLLIFIILLDITRKIRHKKTETL